MTTLSFAAAEQRSDPATVLPIYAITPFTLLDFPGKTACIIWFSGCNMRCPYCHNPQIVKGKGCREKGRIQCADTMAFLHKRQGLLDAVVISGGEATCYPDLPRFLRQIRALGYAVKLDTNGLRPDMVYRLLAESMVDYIALDYKAPEAKFKHVTGTDKFGVFQKSLDLLCGQTSIPFEVRTTVHTDFLDENDVQTIIDDLSARHFSGTYAIQNYLHRDDPPTLGHTLPQSRSLKLSSLDPRTLRLDIRNFA